MPPVPVPSVRSKPRAQLETRPLPEEPQLELQGPHTSACRMGWQDIAPQGEEGHTKSERGGTKVAGGERGQGGSGSASCVWSDGRDFGAQRLLSASPSASLHSAPFSEALWGENPASAHYGGNGSRLAGPGRRKGQKLPGFVSPHFPRVPFASILRTKVTVPNFATADCLAPSPPRSKHSSSPGPVHPSSPSSVSLSR